MSSEMNRKLLEEFTEHTWRCVGAIEAAEREVRSGWPLRYEDMSEDLLAALWEFGAFLPSPESAGDPWREFLLMRLTGTGDLTPAQKWAADRVIRRIEQWLAS